MPFRKIIQFGDSSYVITLPKEWVTKNNLTKGDSIEIEQHEDSLKITPRTSKKSEPPTEKTITIEKEKEIKPKIISAYINKNNIIHLIGPSVLTHSQKIRDTVTNLMALEVVHQSPNKITLKDFLNIENISLHEIIRRIDRIVLSMIEDTEKGIKENKINHEIIKQKENDVNRLTHFVFKVLKRATEPKYRRLLKITNEEILLMWETSLFMEKVADQLKRIIRYIKDKPSKQFHECFTKVCEQYRNSMKAYYTKNPETAIQVITKRPELFHLCDKTVKEVTKEQRLAVEKMKSLNNHASNIARALLKFIN